MTAKEIHKLHIQEHLQEIKDAIAIGIENRSSTIGLHTSACSIDLVELFLHSSNKISAGTIIKHEWFKAPKVGQKISPLVERKLGVDFPNKEEIFSLMYDIEEGRNKLIYGKPNLSGTESILKSFHKLHQLIKNKLQELGEEIE